MFFLHIPFFYDIKVFIVKIQMSTSTPFAYNTGSVINGTTQVGSLAVGTPSSGFTSSPQFWNGPDEELGYVIAVPVSGGTQPTPISGVTASLGFYRSTGLTDSSFIELTNGLFNQSFSSATVASTWLTNNGYWNSYIVVFNATIDTTSKGNNFEVSLPYSNTGTYGGTINWGDGTITTNSFANRAHTYVSGGTYTIRIDGTITEFNVGYYGNNTLSQVLITIDSFGPNFSFGNNLGSYFSNCSHLINIASDIPLTGITNMSNMFVACSSFDGNIDYWDVSNVTNMSGMFNGCSSFDRNINYWNVSNVTNMSAMFYTTPFNQPLNSWNVSNVDDMNNMFGNCSSFNQNISGWNVSNVTNMNYMFGNCSSFNQNIGGWDVSKVTNMFNMFLNCSSFNQDLDGWDVSKVTNMNSMFGNCTSFNQPLSGWNVSNVTNMRYMFNNTSLFNQPLDNWNVSGVTDMSGMFNSCSSFNQNISGWDVSKVTNMSNMFFAALVFNQPLSGWNVSNVTSMDGMFYYASLFNQDLSHWCVTNIPSKPADFDSGATSWILPEPVWGTCPS
jgi:surface protein